MAVATIRVGELLTKNVDKVVSATSAKPASGLLLNAPLSSEARIAQERVLSNHGSRSGSPNSRGAASRGSTSRLEELGAEVQQEDDETEAAGPEPVATSRTASVPLLKVELHSCPSFGEQSCKPLWLHRHLTLQRAYSDTQRAKDLDDDEEDCLERVDEADDSDNSAGEPMEKYLPGWDIARSEVWLLAEAALQAQSAQTAHAIEGTGSSAGAAAAASLLDAGAGMHSELASVAEDTTLDTTTTSTAPAAAASSSSASSAAATSFQAASAAAACQPPPPPPPLLLQRHTAPQPPSLQRLGTALRRACSMNRASLLATPLGLGHALAPATSAFEAGRAACSPARGAAAASDGLSELHSHGGRRHVAFAAGLAAATSAAAAVSQAAGVAAAGLAAATSVGSAAGLALDLGSKALSAGGGLLVDRVQSVASKHATTAVAELILGPSSSAAARSLLVSRVQATVAGASIAWFLLNLVTMSDSLAHLDFEHDFATSAKVVLDLVTSGPSLMENCKDLMHIGVAVSLRVAHRNAGGGGVGVPGGFEV